MLQLVGLGSDPESARTAAADTGGLLYVNHHEERDTRPYSTLVRAQTDDLALLEPAADVGLYVCFARVIKPLRDPLPAERVIASFGMVSHPDRSHREADHHWRDIHAPLALANHRAMCDYTQLSVIATLSGVELDGIALCSFDSRQDMRAKFFNDDEARAVIEADVVQFSDLKRSLRRVVLSQVA